MIRKHKYVRLKKYDEIIIFPVIIDHSDFKNFGVISAGFCYVEKDQVLCFGESVSLKLKSKEEDTDIATKQFFGEEYRF
jgi:hypothetical protein